VNEQVVRFGARDGLVGILTTPVQQRARFAVLLSNTGTHHRVGPYRLNVELARAFAADGIATLRYDRSGLGDSARRDAPGSDHAHAVEDTRDAMTVLTAMLGVDRFVLVALCSGVDTAHEVSREDARVVGAVFIDGYAYPTAGFHWRRTLPRLFDAARWWRFARRRLHRWRHPDFFVEPVVDGSRVFTREIPTLDRYRDDVRLMAARGVRLLMVYTGAVGGSVNAPSQLYEMIGADISRRDVAVSWMPDADHLFTSPSARRVLTETLRQWLGTVGG
jgi:hypothetical protein